MLRFLASPASLLIYTSLFWGANSVVARAVAHDIGPMSVTFWRWLLAIALLLPFTYRHVRSDWHVIVRHWPFIAVLGLSSVTVYTVSIYWAAHTTPALNLSLIGSTVPAFSLVVAWLWLGERVTLAQGLGLVLGFLGVGIIVCRGEYAVLRDFRFTQGDLILLVGVIMWAIYSVLLKVKTFTLHHLSLLTGVFVTGFLGTLPLFVWEIASGETFAINAAGLFAIVFGALFVSIGAYFCFIRGVAALGPNKANAFGYLAPLFSAALAVPLLGEPFALYHGVSFALIVAGVYLATTRRPINASA